MAIEILRAMIIAEIMLEIHKTSRRQLFFPQPSLLWLGMSPQTLDAESREDEFSGAQDHDESPG